MKIQYLLLIALMLPTAPVLAADGDDSGNPKGFWARNGDTIAVSCISGFVSGTLSTIAGLIIQSLFTREDQEAKEAKKGDAILQRDEVNRNTRKYIQDLRDLAATHPDKKFAAQCLQDAESTEKLFAQGITLRNKALAKSEEDSSKNLFERKIEGAKTTPTERMS